MIDLPDKPKESTINTPDKSQRINFSEQYEIHHQQVYRFLLVRTCNRDNAHDLTAQTFMTAYESQHKFKGESKFITWIMSIAKHKLVDFYRSKRDLVSLNQATDLSHPAPLPEDAVEHKLKLERVTHAMQSLSEDRQEAIALRLFSGLTNPEIAEVMNRSPESVAMLVYRGLQDLQTRLNIQE